MVSEFNPRILFHFNNLFNSPILSKVTLFLNLYFVPLDPCDPNPCGAGAKCENDIGNAVCSCPTGKAGDPLVRCSKLFYDFTTFLVFPKS